MIGRMDAKKKRRIMIPSLLVGYLLAMFLFHSHAEGAPFLILKCPTGGVPPTTCAWVVDGAPVVNTPPHTTPSGVWCYTDLAGLSKLTLPWQVTPTNSIGPGPKASGTLSGQDYLVPAALGSPSVVQTLPSQ